MTCIGIGHFSRITSKIAMQRDGVRFFKGAIGSFARKKAQLLSMLAVGV